MLELAALKGYSLSSPRAAKEDRVKKPIPDGKDQGCLDNWVVPTDCEYWYTNQGEVPNLSPWSCCRICENVTSGLA
jgi:hypothetical protein